MNTEQQIWHALSPQEAMNALNTDPSGLAADEAARRLLERGANELTRKGGDGLWQMLWRQLHNPIGWLLIVAGFVALLLSKIPDAIVVFGAVVINAIIGFIQEYRAGKAIDELAAMVPDTATVIRNGQRVTVPARELVPGDIVSLQSGDKVPADLRIIEAKNLLVEEAALTGESLPVAKHLDATAPESSLGDRLGMAYSGTLVIKGTACGVVVASGDSTELGRINVLLHQTEQLMTPLTRQLARVTTGITVAVIAIVALLIGFGIWIKDAPIGESLMVAVTLAVAAIPEGLPAVVTIALAIGVRRMASRHAVVRYLPAVETLGATTVICSDKTGTLTRNEMTVQVAWVEGREYRFSGVGYSPAGEIEHDGVRLTDLPAGLRELIVMGILCNDAAVSAADGIWTPVGDPTEAALVVAGHKAGLAADDIRGQYPRLDVIPFESETKFMATLNRMDREESILLKGAPETVLQRCLLSEVERNGIVDVIETYARQGLRIIAFAHQRSIPDDFLLQDEKIEGYTFVGLMGMMDPPRTEAHDAIRICQGAGITVKMITGDHPDTAEAIGRQLGLLTPAQNAIPGHELESLSDRQLRSAVLSTNVFARVAPEHKLRLVEALQAESHVVAMTGDGVNDAPALKRADIGVAMGITGTSVSKEAAKVVLIDDNFASIAAAVEEGRRVYDNLIKSLAFILPTNLALAAILSVAMFFFPTVTVDGGNVLLLAMSPTQTLWINLVASITLSIPLAFEMLEPNAMRRPPRLPDEPIFSRFMIGRLILVAAIMTAGGCGLFLWEYFRIIGTAPITASRHALALAEAQTICVTVVTCAQIFYLFNCRSFRNSFFSLGAFSNPSIFVGTGVLLLLHACFMYLPPLQNMFGSAALDARAWLVAVLAGAIVLPVISVEKWIRRRYAH